MQRYHCPSWLFGNTSSLVSISLHRHPKQASCVWLMTDFMCIHLEILKTALNDPKSRWNFTRRLDKAQTRTAASFTEDCSVTRFILLLYPNSHHSNYIPYKPYPGLPVIITCALHRLWPWSLTVHVILFPRPAQCVPDHVHVILLDIPGPSLLVSMDIRRKCQC